MNHLNRRFLAITLGVLVVGAAVLFAIHHFQFNRQSDFFGAQAKTELLAGEYPEAIRLFQQSLKMDDRSQTTLMGLAESYERVGNFSGSYNIAQQLSRLSPNDIANQVRLARVSLQMGRFTDAIGRLDSLLDQPPTALQPEPGSLVDELPPLLGRNRVELFGLLGDARLGNRDVNGAVDAYRQAVAEGTAPLETYLRLAQTLLVHADLPDEGKVVVDQIVERFPDRVDAYLARGQWYLELYGDGLGHDGQDQHRADALKKAVADSEAALKLAAFYSGPDAVDGPTPKPAMVAESLEFAVAVAIADKRLDDALRLSEEGIEKFPAQGAFYRLAHATLSSMREQAVNPDVQQSLVKRGTAVLEQGVERLPADATLLWALASDHIEQERMDAARKITDRLRSLNYGRELVDYLDARLLAASGDVSVAAAQMEKVRSDVIERPDLVRLVDLTLSDLYEKMGDTDRQIAVLRRVIANDPFLLTARERLALAYLRSGRVDEAVQEYRLVADRPDASIRAPLNFARLLLMQNLSREPADRDWGRLEALIGVLSQQPSLAADIALLNAEVFVAQEKPDAARQELADAPGDPRIWSARISLEIKEQKFEAAAELITAAEAAIGDRPALRYAKAAAATATNRDDLDQQVSQWSVPPSPWSREDKLELAKLMVPLLISNGQYADAERLAELSAELEPDNVVARLQLMQIAFQSEKPERLREQLAAFEKVSGRDARWYYGNALAISLESSLPTATQSSSEKTEITAEANARAQESLAEAAVLRPDWSLIPAFSGNMHDRAGNTDSAIVKYNQAVDLGWRNPASIRRLIQLLTEKERFGEADSVIRRLRTGDQPFTSDMARIASEVSVEMADLSRAVRLAKEAAELSGAVEDFLWLGQLSEMNSDPTAAGQAYERAIEIAPTASRPTLAWVGYLERQSRMGEAREALTRYEQSVDSSDSATMLTIADGYQRIGAVEDAARVLRDVPSDSLTDLASHQRYLQIIVAADGPAAGIDQLARWLGISAAISPAAPAEAAASDPPAQDVTKVDASASPLAPPIAHWARRQLALSLASTRNPSVYGQAKTLIAKNLNEAESNTAPKLPGDIAFDDRRAAAIVDATFRSSSEPELALEQFESMISQGWQPSTDDQFLVGQLAAVAGDWTRGRRLMLPLLSNDELRQPVHVKTYVRMLLRNDDAGEAQLWLDRLQKSGVSDEETAELTADVLLRRGNVDRLLKMLTIQADGMTTADTETQWFATTLTYPKRFELLTRLTTRLMDDIKKRFESEYPAQPASADAMRAAVDADPTVQRLRQATKDMASQLQESGGFPGTFYAMQLLRRGDCDGAVKAISRVAADAPENEIVAFAGAVLVQANCTNAYGKLADVLRGIGGADAENLNYALLMARLSEAQGDYDQAMQTYDEILAKDPENFGAGNNLATLLSLRKQDPARALELIERIIRTSGETLVTLDTRGVCHLAAGKTAAAMSDFLAASEIFPHPIVYFHLAQAFQQAGDKVSAEKNFRRAIRSGLNRSELHTLEFPAYESFTNALDAGKSRSEKGV